MVQRYNLDTEARIIKVATKMFMTDGFKRTSTRAIAETIGITQPNLYHYFKNKEAIYTRVIAEQLREINEHLMIVIRHSGSGIANELHEMTMVLLNHENVDYLTMQYDMKNVISKHSREEIYLQWETHMLRPFEALFKKYHIQSKELSTKEMARLYFSQMSATMHLYEHLSHPEFVRKFIAIFLYGVVS